VAPPDFGVRDHDSTRSDHALSVQRSVNLRTKYPDERPDQARASEQGIRDAVVRSIAHCAQRKRKRSSRNCGNLLHCFNCFCSALNLAIDRKQEENLCPNAAGTLGNIGRFKVMNTKALAIVVVIGTAMALPVDAQAKSRSDNEIFCAAIGLSLQNQVACTKQLTTASDTQHRKSMQTTWVARGAMMERPSNFNEPPSASATRLPRSTTHYQSRVAFVPNRVAADIKRAANRIMTDPEWTTAVRD
jgi:hypothetical protein